MYIFANHRFVRLDLSTAFEMQVNASQKESPVAVWTLLFIFIDLVFRHYSDYITILFAI